MPFFLFVSCHLLIVGRDSLVSTATHHRLNCPGIESRWGQYFQALRLTQPLVQLVSAVFHGGKAAGAWR
jgi:hypothetical protein